MAGETFDVILTHEHTDFDALASLLAAALLFPEALPVLPRQLNRNVRDFLALHKNHLPFLTDRELPRGRVRRAILVDTQSANWVKGMDENVELFIIDHHPADGDQSRASRFWFEPVGANTTILVEKLMEQGQDLTPVQATLLALGIHEDTGSLTYSSTTHRDARCLAWLLQPEHHVNLEVVAQFLHHPLSEAQRALLEQLIAHSEFLEVAGHTIVIAQATAPEFKEEISALASRLRDFHETDAVFLVIDLGDIVQVVARSTTDEIDVGKVAEGLGGGGHTRAAAAPVHGPGVNTQTVRDRIVALVEQHSRSALTVGDIMSAGRPQILRPHMTIQEALELMQRYGHEGFPVVEELPDGREVLLGVLTRREADRAVSHRLGNEPVTRFMRAGQVTVRPDDAVSTLRRRMIESNWGQIPVVDDQGHIIGIVTRTDLIKLWDEKALPRRHAEEIAARLQSSLTPVQHHLLALIGDEVDQMGYTVYVVGGFVRDLLLGTRQAGSLALDMDIVIEGNAIEFAQRMQRLYGGRVVPHRRFGTAKWLLDDPDHPVDREKLLAGLEATEKEAADLPPHLDFVTARTEFYTEPTALPTVERSSIKLDLHRRDFTINTLAVCLNPERWGELLDFYGGLNDLNAGIIRVLHSLSFVDDPTRILRAVRYEQRFRFRIEPRTLELLQDALELLDRVSPARLRHEFERILQEEEPERTLARLAELGVLARIHPELEVDEWLADRFARLRAALAAPPEDPESDPALREEAIERLYWGLLVFRLSPKANQALFRRLGLRGETQRLVQGLMTFRAHMEELDTPGLPASRAVAILDEVRPAAVALAAIACADRPQIQQVYRQYRDVWRHVQPELDGNDLIALGLPRGPLYRRILTALRAARLDGKIQSREEEVEMALALAAEAGADKVQRTARSRAQEHGQAGKGI
ncbi:MAG: tRNA nucleotidyltransferase [Litorilinea sp.]|nr:MAG: tRNA nucleotidyltransferase [Litorilinea sp.]